MRSVARTLGWLSAASLLLTACYGAYQIKPDDPRSVSGLTPNVEDKDAGLVALAPGFDLKRYKVVAIDRFPVTDAAIKDDEDRRRAQEMSAILQTELVRRLRDTGLFTRVVNLGETEFRPGPEPTLRLEGVISRLGGGSQAARAMAGLYGAGAARAQAELRFVDTQTGQPVLVTADRRRATMGFFGGSAREHWKEAFDDMARDLGKFLIRLSSGQAPGK
jgi:Domain of unknown function (DUF4410)/Protein of unknown function (DUF3313)